MASMVTRLSALATPDSRPTRERHHPKHAEKAIDGVLRHVSTAREGERNQILFWGACRLRERVDAGQLGQGEATALLVNAARVVGLQDNEAQRTISSAWRAA